MSTEMPTNWLPRIAIVGVGQVGGAAAYALILSSIASELLLVETDVDLRTGQVCDLTDVAYSSNSGTRVRAASHREAGQCDIVVITAGSKHSLGQTSLDYTFRNISIVRNVMDAMMPFGPNTIVLVVSNPVDLLTSLVQKLSGLPASQVLGSGTLLDSVRLRWLLADRIKAAPNSIDIHVLGVHGDFQVVAWSNAKVGGASLDYLMEPAAVDRANLANECKYRSESIVRAKGASPFGIGSVVSSICCAIVLDKRNVYPLSHLHPKFDCCVSLPAVLGRKGILGTVELQLDSDEDVCIADSAKSLKRMMDRICRDWQEKGKIPALGFPAKENAGQQEYV